MTWSHSFWGLELGYQRTDNMTELGNELGFLIREIDSTIHTILLSNGISILMCWIPLTSFRSATWTTIVKFSSWPFVLPLQKPAGARDALQLVAIRFGNWQLVFFGNFPK